MKVLKIIKTSLVLAVAFAVVGNDVVYAMHPGFNEFVRDVKNFDPEIGTKRRLRNAQPVRAPIVHAPIVDGRNAGHGNNQMVRQESKTSCGMNVLKTVLKAPVTVSKAVFLTMPKAVLNFVWNHKKEVFFGLIVAGAIFYAGRATAPTTGSSTGSSCGSCEDQSSFKAKYDDCVSEWEKFTGKGLPQCFSASNPSSWFSQTDRRHDCEQACRLLPCIP